MMSTYGKQSFKAFNQDQFYNDLTKGFELLSEGYKKLKSKSYGIQYEQLVTQPDEEIKKLLDYLEIEYEDHLVTSINQHEKRGTNYDPTMDLNRKLDDHSLEKWKTIFNTRFRKMKVKQYIKSLSDESLVIQGYQKQEIINEIMSLDNKGKYNLLYDVYDFHKAKLIARYACSSYN